MKLSLEQLAHLTGAKILRGDSHVVYTGVASLLDAQLDEVSFLGNEKYFQDFLATQAGVVLVPAGLPQWPEEKVALLEVAGNPSVAFNEVVKFFLASSKQFEAGIHPSAVIDPSVQLDATQVCIGPHVVIEAQASVGAGTKISAGCYIGRGVQIGQNCTLHPNVVVRERCKLGNRVVIQPNATIGSDGFGYQLVEGKFVSIEQAGIVELGDDVEIGANSTIDRARFGKTFIGEDTKIDNLVQIGHNCVIGKHTIIVAQSGIAGSTRVGDYVTIAAQCGIAGHLNLGDGISMGARTGVLSDLEGGKRQIYWGSPCSTYAEASKQFVAFRKLPALVKEVRALKKSLEEKDSPTTQD